MKVVERLIEAVRSAAVYNSDVQVAPVCILWPDQEGQWQSDISRLQAELPELLVLGDYAPDKRTGPAIWLRCAVAKKIDDVTLPDDRTPILYLPGVSRQELRAVETCPPHLKPLAELQYRGVIWSQINSKDWTILAFLKSDQGGLKLSVAQDNDTKNSMQLALYRLLDEEIDLLNGKRLDKDYFNTLLTGGDPVRDLLQWLDQSETFRESRGEQEWKAFVEICKSHLGFNPQSEGLLKGASKLASREGPWSAAWNRFAEAPKRYPNIPVQIRKCQAPAFDLFSDVESTGGWPQWNEAQELNLQQDLVTLTNLPSHQARTRIRELETVHGPRRKLVWAELGEAPLAQALEHLAALADITNESLAAGSAQDLAMTYCSRGWKADDAVIRALALVERPKDCSAVSVAIRSVYLPWAEDSARHLQKVVDGTTYPGGTIDSFTVDCTDGECILFVDGLRFDSSKRLAEMLRARTFEVAEKPRWTALPSVTPTGKPSVSPVRNKIRGKDVNDDFEPCVADTLQSLKGGYRLKRLLKDEGWIVLDQHNNGNGQGNSWCEFGDIDHEGHSRGWKLSRHIEILLREIRDRIAALLDAGWKSVRVVTDHGWLLLPGGLPKIELPSGLTDTKWGRCAALKPGASTGERLFPWFWNPNQHFVLADGISCFRKGEEYTHGGLSLQECLTLELTIRQGSGAVAPRSLEFTDVVWKGLRCTISIDGDFDNLSFDIRMHAGEANSSVVVAPKPIKSNGTASVVVEDEELENKNAIIVLLDENKNLVAQIETVVGGETK